MKSLITIMTFLLSMNVYSFSKVDLMLRYTQSMEGAFQSMYAMKDWKREHINWDMDQKFQDMYKLLNDGNISNLNDYHKMLNDFTASAQDWHVGIYFARTGNSYLPLTIKSAEGRYFIVWIDRKKLPESDFPFNIGDEIISIGGEKVSDLATRIATTFGNAENTTAKSFAELNLTRRIGFYRNELPSGSTLIAMKKKSENFETLHQTLLTWFYTPEKINYNDKGLDAAYNPVQYIIDNKKKLNRNLYVTINSLEDQKFSRNLHHLGMKESFLPKFGKIVWEAPSDNYYQAYIYQTKDRKLYGYFRIKDYMPYDFPADNPLKPFKDLEKIIEHFAENTDGLVIDQLNNPGGDIFYGYFIASMITKNIIETIPEQEILEPDMYLSALTILKELEDVKEEKDLENIFGKNPNLGGLKVTMDMTRMMIEYYRGVIEDYESGLLFGRLGPVYGIKHVMPHEKIHFDKPVVILINELDISAGDFFPALIQDNQIATLFGTKTSGAGGYIIGNYISNRLGIRGYSVTGSIAFRKEDRSKPIENLGITPDVEYKMKVEDLTDNYKSYIKAVNDLLDSKTK